MGLVPRSADVQKQARRGFDGRHLRYIGWRSPRENGRRTIDARLRKPGFRRCDQTRRHAGALPSGEFADDVRSSIVWWKLVRVREIDRRGQKLCRTCIAWPDGLDDGEIQDWRIRTAPRLDIGHGAVRSAEVNSDKKRGARCS